MNHHYRDIRERISTPPEPTSAEPTQMDTCKPCGHLLGFHDLSGCFVFCGPDDEYCRCKIPVLLARYVKP